MVQNGIAHDDMARRDGDTRRGRPPKFEADAVVEAAVDAFMDKGFEATTLNDLETRTGVDRSTLYNSFGGKAGLYERATGFYLDRARDGLFSVLFDGEGADGVDDVLDFLTQLEAGLTTQQEILGCLIVNDMAAGAAPVAAGVYRTMLEDGLRLAFQRTPAGTDLSDVEVDSRVALVSAAVLGVNLVRTQTEDHQPISDLVGGIRHQVAGWRAAA